MAIRSRYEIRGGGFFRYVPRVDWEEHAAHLHETWEPGQHVSLFAPTDHGKTHLVLRGLAPIWPEDYQWLTIDVKGDDPLLATWGTRVKKIPSRFMRNHRYENQRFRLVVPEAIEAIADAAASVTQALRQARMETKWIVHLNEVRALSDPKPPGLNLAPRLEQLWLRGRPHITVIAETQRPAWVPGSMYDQPTHIYIGGLVDERSKQRVAEIGGDTDNLLRAIDQLEEHEFVYHCRKIRPGERKGLLHIVKAPRS